MKLEQKTKERREYWEIETTSRVVHKENRKWIGIWSHLEKISWTQAIDLTGIDKLYITGFAL